MQTGEDTGISALFLLMGHESGAMYEWWYCYIKIQQRLSSLLKYTKLS